MIKRSLSQTSSPRLALLVAGVCLLLSAPLRAEWYSDVEDIMGTIVSVTLWHQDASQAQAAIDDMMAEMRRIDATLSPYKDDSELSRVNRNAANGPVKISSELATIIDKALYFSHISQGAFDISFASVGRYYDYREQQQPDAKQKARLLPAINYHLIAFNKDQSTIEYKHPDLAIDLGGIAKGYAVDRATAILQQYGVESATVSAGGDSRVLGDKLGKPWLVGIKNPRGYDSSDNSITGKLREGHDRVAITLPLSDTAVSTSGDYERYFIDASSGKRIHHIINPRTGESAGGIASVTILGPRSFDADPMSTTVFVMGVEAGLALINRLADFECIIINTKGEVHYSDGLRPPQ